MTTMVLRPLLRLWFLGVGAAALLAVGCGGQTSPLSSPTAPSRSMSGTLSDDGADSPAVALTAAERFSTLGNGGSDKGDKGDKGKGAPDFPDGDEHGNGELSGFVTGVGTNALTVRGVNVVVNDSTRIRHGNRTLTMHDIQVGDHVQVRGHMDGNNLVATEIKVEDTGNDNDEDEGDHGASVKGTVSGISSSSGCPVRTFTINTTPATTVKTDASTVFEDVTCTALANGALVEVQGVRQSDGTILAKTIEAEDGPDEVEGKISELSGTGSCPALTFKVGTTTVTTSASTTFSGVTCAALANGTAVEVEGTKQANGSMAAASVKPE